MSDVTDDDHLSDSTLIQADYEGSYEHMLDGIENALGMYIQRRRYSDESSDISSSLPASDNEPSVSNSASEDSLDLLSPRRYEQLRTMRNRQRRQISAHLSISGQETIEQHPHREDDGLNLLDIADRPIDQINVADDSEVSEVFARIRNRLRNDDPIPVVISSSSDEDTETSHSARSSNAHSDEEYELPHSPILSSHPPPLTGAPQDPTTAPGPIVSPPRSSITQSDFHVSDEQRERHKSTKRKHSSPNSKDAKKFAENLVEKLEDDDDGMSCPICFESWTNSGKHRLTSLKCGHIFGQKCIERWLKDCQQKCPQCNAKARKNDLRIIYAKKLATLDTTDLECALRDADKERSGRRECEMELAKVRMQYHMTIEECDRLKKQVSSIQMQLDLYKEKSPSISSSQLTSASNQSGSTSSGYRCIKSNVITQSGGCRVMDFHSRTQQFVVSQPSPHASFMTGFGVKRISASDLKGGFFTILHQKPIKDLRFSPHTDHHLLSASQDGSLRITDLMSNAKIHEYKMEKPVWSCCWDSKDRNIVYAGLSNGCVTQFDLRNTSESMSVIENTNSRCPIVSLYHIPPTATDYFQGRGGLLTGTLEGASFWQDTGSPENQSPSLIANYKPTLLPLEPGSCTGLQYCSEMQCFLATYRPGRSYRSTTHLLCELHCRSSAEESNQLSCNIIESYTGGQSHKMLTRNALFVLPAAVQKSSDDNLSLLACVGDEANSKVHIYEHFQTKPIQSLKSDGGPPLDIIPAHIDSAPALLAILSQNTLKVFQYT